MRHRNTVLTVVLMLTLVVSLAGCKKKVPETVPAPAVEAPPPPEPAPPRIEVEPDFPPEPIVEAKPDNNTLIGDWNRTGLLQTEY